MVKYQKNRLIIPLNYSISLISTILKNFDVEITDIEKENEYIFYLNKQINNEILKIINNILSDKLPIECKLYLLANYNLNIREIFFIRAITKYQKQLLFEFEEEGIVKTLITYPQLTALIMQYFNEKFKNKDISKENSIEAQLKEIKNSNHHKILSYFYTIVKNITKTNFFLNKETISFKIDTKNFKHMLFGIQPNIEMFVYHKDFNGIHLRMSKISRGGIRFSNREDFREEVKDLVKTQMIKNALIVPDGAKGGFYIYDNLTLKEAYSLFIDALLDLIDEDDFYFVVAADRGTAKMSDVANEIAIKKGYFLKDAFASGGKNGYDHKKLGITAKGAIKSASRHFLEIKKDIYKDKLSVVGVGSMRGDVFGNGMLINKNFLLIAAISHNEIFIDPNPNPKIAYEERKRLFENELGWEYYDKNKISKGGGVFKRDETIKLSPQIKALINTDEEYLKGEELIKKLLKLKVDILYFGGIGTYVKASDELNIHISDKQNENIRINGSDINAFCVIEGANLAFTQKARYEYAIKGGRINLDAIDNSAGVNISDYEVNLKISLNNLVEKNIISEQEKIDILHNLTDEVIEKVLSNNEAHSLIISLDSRSIYKEKLIKVLNILEKHTEFKREHYQIPKDIELELFYRNDKLIRPLSALLILYSKRFLKKYILENMHTEEFEEFFIDYFPKSFEYKKTHLLKKEITATQITNHLINKFGIDFISDFNKNFKYKIISYITLMKLYKVDKLFEESKRLPTKKQYEFLIELQKTVKFANMWLNKLLKEGKNISIEHPILIDVNYFQENETLMRFLPILLYFKTQNYNFGDILEKFNILISNFKIHQIFKEIKKIKPKNQLEKNLKDDLEELVEMFIIKLLEKFISLDKKEILNQLKSFDIEIKKEKSLLEIIHTVNKLVLTL